jgi:hypothetical protein
MDRAAALPILSFDVRLSHLLAIDVERLSPLPRTVECREPGGIKSCNSHADTLALPKTRSRRLSRQMP